MARAIRVLAVVSASILTASVAVATAPVAVAAGPPREKPVKVGSYDVVEPRDAATDVSDPAWIDPVVTVPEAGEAVVDVPTSGWAPAGDLPIALARPTSGIAATRVRVRVLSQPEVAAVGGRLIGFELTRADGVGSVGAVAVRVDYSGIAKAYGGDFASRLHLVRAVTCNPEVPCSRPLVAAANRLPAAELLATSVAVRSDPAVAPTAPSPDSGFGPQPGAPEPTLPDPYESSTTYALAASAAGPNGDYSASQLSASDNWSVGVGSGAFTYGYPIKVPPAVAGPAPALGLNYNSQSVDGRTLAANGQVSKVGEGWSFEPGFIERRFHSCRDENVARDDLCWSAEAEYFISFMGHSGEIVRTSTSSKEWRLRGDDPGWRILSYTACCANGDNDGEYFVVITPNGVKYWFGYGAEPRNVPSKYTNSAWTVPVYGNNSGEPCYSTVAAAAWCQQAYRWNVDRVLDTNDNVASLFYAKETNSYSRNGTTTLPTQYTRSGYLTSIEYGQRDNAEDGTAFARVRVNTMDRCVTQVACPAPTPSSAQTSYPDVPLDRMCTSATSCAADQTAPTFWSTKEITSIQTEFWNAESDPPAYELVGTDKLTYSFPSTGDTTSPSLWLKDITHTGEYGIGSTELPGVRMSGTALPNRVNTGSGVPPLNKYRIDSLSTDLGARVNVTYATPRPCPLAPAVPAWDTNPYHCYPAWYDPQDGQTAPGWVAFHKYVVTNLVTEDVRGGGEDKSVTYTYSDAPAWHHEDSRLTKSDRQTWSDYRGHSDVRVNAAGGGASAGTDTRFLVFRGMYGDKLANGTAKSVQVTDSTGAWFNDFHYRAGHTLEVKRYDASDGHFASTLYRYWAERTVNAPDGFSPHDAHYVRPSQTIVRTKNLDSGAWREHESTHTYGTASAMLATTSVEASSSTQADDLCTKVGYTDLATAPNAGTSGGNTHWMVDRPHRTITYAGLCGSGSTTVVSQTQHDYDDHVYQAVPTDGNVTQTRAFIDATTTAVTKTDYDAHGRVTSIVSPNENAAGTNGAATTTYSPTTGYPYNGVTTTNVLGQSTTTAFYSAFGTPRRVTDANADTTTIGIDHLGRTTSVTRPGDSSGVPGLAFAYRVETGVPNRVTTTRAITATSTVTTADYLDGLGRVIQTQLPPADGSTSGRRLIVHRYDTLGQKAAESTPFGATGDVGSGLATYSLTDVPLEVRYGYDSAGRVYAETQYAAGVSKFSTRTDYHGWHHVVDSPVAADVDYHTDVSGRITKVVQRPSSTTTTATLYGYTPLGDLDTITDAGGNVTNYDYDQLRRRTVTTDPDQGTWQLGYNREGDVTSVVDAKQQMVTYVFDRLRRKTAAHAGDAMGTPLARWRYDTDSNGSAVANGIGRLTAATRYSGGSEYTTTIGGYDNRGRVTAKTTTIPSEVGALAGSYTYGYGYNLSDEQTSVTLPAAGGLPAETVTTVLNNAGLPEALTTSLDSTAPYIASTTYDLAGRVTERGLAGAVFRYYAYDTSAGRLASIQSTAPLAANGGVPGIIEDVTYSYDADGNVTSITDPIAGSGGVAQTECFRYDTLNRLTTAFTTNSACTASAVPTSHGAEPYDLAYTYNTLGDIATARSGASTAAYTYTGSGHPHAPATVGGAEYQYDANGATTTRPTSTGAQTLTWNALHQLESLAGPGAASLVYDANGARLLRVAGTKKTLYLDGMELTATTTGGSTTVAATRYYGGGAMRTTDGVRVLLRNHQNSTTAAYDTVAGTVAYQRYTPFGSRRGAEPLAATDRRFLDKTEDESGLIAMGARYYDPVIGRFTAADTLVAPWQPANLSAYTYANNNPVTLSDPSGMGPGCTDDMLDCEERQEAYADYQAGRAVGGGESGRSDGGSYAPPGGPATGSETGTNTWVDPGSAGGGGSGPVIRDPAHWCLVGQPAGTQGPCGAPPEYAEYDDKGTAQAAMSYLARFGGPVADGAQGAAYGATVAVAGYTNKSGKHVVGYNRYREGLGDLAGIIKAKKLLVVTKWVGRAFVVVQFADAASESWTDPDVAAHSTKYRVGHAVSSGGGAAVGGWGGAWVGMKLGGLAGGAVGLGSGPGAAITAGVGAIGGGIAGAMGGKWLATKGYEWGFEVVS